MGFSRSWKSGTAALAVAALALSGCAGAPEETSSTQASQSASGSGQFPVTITNCGVEVTVEQAPSKLIALNQGATEVALALDLTDSMAGTAYLDDEISERWVDRYDQVPVLAGAEYPSKEVFLAAEPDFAYASYASAFTAENVGDRTELTADGIGNYLSPFGCDDEGGRPDSTMAAAWDEVADIATLFGVPDAADELIADQQSELDALSSEAAAAGLSALWFDSGDATPFVGAGEGGPQIILDTVGATNIFADMEGNWGDGSWEDVVAADPDFIVLADASWSTAEEKIDYLKSDPVTSQLRAVQTEAFVTVSFSESTPGVRLVDGAAKVSEQVANLES